MDALKLKKMCCRRHFLTHVDIEWASICYVLSVIR
jgi:DNA-directed RNA polymerase subunit N (RpoN/RPB10)